MAQGIPFIMLGLTAASTAVGVMSSVAAGKAEERAAERTAADTRAAAAKTAAQIRLSAPQKAEDTKKEHQRIIAAQAARYGASGLRMEGTPLLVQMESLKESEEQLRRIIEGGETEASIYERTGERKAATYEEAGRQAGISGQIGGVKALLSGATSMGTIGRQYHWW